MAVRCATASAVFSGPAGDDVVGKRGSRVSTWNAEDTLLLHGARAALGGGGTAPRLDGLDAMEVLQRAAHHGLLGLVGPSIMAELPALEPEVRARGQRQTVQNLRLAGALRGVSKRLHADDVPFLVLKGLPLALALYGSVGARRCRDIDLLVRGAEFARARASLRALGFHPVHALTPRQERLWMRGRDDLPMRHPDGTLVELHRSVGPGPPDRARAHADALFRAARTVRIGDVDVPAVTGAAALPYLAWHGGKHAWSRLFWLVDVAALTARSSPEEIEAAWALARRSGAERSLLLAWVLCERFLDVELPAPAVETARNSRTVRRLADRVAQGALGSPGPVRPETLAGWLTSFSWALAHADGPRAKLGAVRAYLLTPQLRDVRAFPLPERLAGLYPFLRPVRLAVRLSRSLLARALPASASSETSPRRRTTRTRQNLP